MDLLIFDMHGVIYPNIIGGSRIIVKKLYDRIKEPKIGYEEFYLKYKKWTKGEISEDIFWDNVTDYNYEECLKEHLDTFKPDMNIVQIVEKIRNNYKTVILSNYTVSWADYLLKRDNLDKVFSQVYISEKMKMTKSNKELFESIINKNKSKKTYLIDDQIKNLVTASEVRYNHSKI